MVLRSTLFAGTVALTLGIPFAFANTIPPSDIPPPVYDTSAIPQGALTRGQFIDIIGTRLFSASDHDSCFSDLVGDYAPDYTLLFTDVSLRHPLASSVCVMMKSHLVRGSGNMLFPNQLISAAEVAAVFSRLSFMTRELEKGEPWYLRYMESMRAMDRDFTFRPGDRITGTELNDILCVLKRHTPQLDPKGELAGC